MKRIVKNIGVLILLVGLSLSTLTLVNCNGAKEDEPLWPKFQHAVIGGNSRTIVLLAEQLGVVPNDSAHIGFYATWGAHLDQYNNYSLAAEKYARELQEFGKFLSTEQRDSLRIKIAQDYMKIGVLNLNFFNIAVNYNRHYLSMIPFAEQQLDKYILKAQADSLKEWVKLFSRRDNNTFNFFRGLNEFWVGQYHTAETYFKEVNSESIYYKLAKWYAQTCKNDGIPALKNPDKSNKEIGLSFTAYCIRDRLSLNSHLDKSILKSNFNAINNQASKSDIQNLYNIELIGAISRSGVDIDPDSLIVRLTGITPVVDMWGDAGEEVPTSYYYSRSFQVLSDIYFSKAINMLEALESKSNDTDYWLDYKILSALCFSGIGRFLDSAEQFASLIEHSKDSFESELYSLYHDFFIIQGAPDRAEAFAKTRRFLNNGDELYEDELKFRSFINDNTSFKAVERLRLPTDVGPQTLNLAYVFFLKGLKENKYDDLMKSWELLEHNRSHANGYSIQGNEPLIIANLIRVNFCLRKFYFANSGIKAFANSFPLTRRIHEVSQRIIIQYDGIKFILKDAKFEIDWHDGANLRGIFLNNQWF